MASSTPYPQKNGESSGLQDVNLVHLSLIIVVGIFATTLAQPSALGRLPILFLLKDRLHVSKSENSSFFFICGLFWYLKPFYAGILTDAFPLFGTRRRWYLLLSSLLAGISWILLGLPGFKDFHDKHTVVPYTYQTLLIGCVIINLFMVMASTVVGAIIVEAGQKLGATGRLSSVRQLTFNFCGLVSGPLGGLLASGIFMRAAGVNALMILSIFPVAYLYLREKPQAVPSSEAFRTAGTQLVTVFTSGVLWYALVFVALFYFAPGIGTVLTYRQEDVLKFSPQAIGNLGIFGGGAGMIAATAYGLTIKRFSIRVMLFFGITIAAIGGLGYLFYHNYVQAMIVEFENGFCFGFAEISIIDFAARATPKGSEGMGYSLLMSVRNVSLLGADVIGSKLSDAKVPFETLVVINSATSAIVLILLPFMPVALRSRKDADVSVEVKEAANTPKTAEAS